MTTTSVFHEAAKKLMQSGSCSEKLRVKSSEAVQLLPKRTETKKVNNQKALHVGCPTFCTNNFQLNVYDLPDVEERAEDNLFSPPSKEVSPKLLTPPIPRFSTTADGDVTAWWSSLES